VRRLCFARQLSIAAMSSRAFAWRHLKTTAARALSIPRMSQRHSPHAADTRIEHDDFARSALDVIQPPAASSSIQGILDLGAAVGSHLRRSPRMDLVFAHLAVFSSPTIVAAPSETSSMPSCRRARTCLLQETLQHADLDADRVGMEAPSS
jgi:hypothetical protein